MAFVFNPAIDGGDADEAMGDAHEDKTIRLRVGDSIPLDLLKKTMVKISSLLGWDAAKTGILSPLIWAKLHSESASSYWKSV